MATTAESRNGMVIVITLIIAMLFMLVPMPDTARYFRPEWVVLTLVYWAMALPQRVGIGVGWITGLLMDVTMGGTLGIMAFSYAFAVYLIARFHLQLRQYPLWQQALHGEFGQPLGITFTPAHPHISNTSTCAICTHGCA